VGEERWSWLRRSDGMMFPVRILGDGPGNEMLDYLPLELRRGPTQDSEIIVIEDPTNFEFSLDGEAMGGWQKVRVKSMGTEESRETLYMPIPAGSTWEEI